ncbi:class I SAM-dependent methyltransferase [Candidatus Latescibacterota bacterium]
MPLSDEKSNNISYRFVSGQPVLVNYDNSVLDEKEVLERNGVSALTRKQCRLKRLIKTHLLQPKANQLAQQLAQEFVRKLKEKVKKPRLLIIGAGGQGNGTDVFYDDSDIQVIGFDIYASPLTHFIADAHNIPIETESIDGVWIQYVLEHVLEPWTVVSEIRRVLRSDGLVYSETAFLQQVHEGAYDFVRFTHSGHRWLFSDFVEFKSGIAMGPGIHLLGTLEHIVRGVFRSRVLGQAIKLSFFWLQLVEKLIPVRYCFNNASSFFFFGSKAKTSLLPKDIVKYYKGKM